MCDIWKDNKNLKQLTETDVQALLISLKKFGTKQVVMSGGEALLNPNFFSLCRMLKDQDIGVCLLSTGLLLKKHAEDIVEWVDDVVVSLDGDEPLHDAIRNLPGAFGKMHDGIKAIRNINPAFKITGRSVIHKLNFRAWPLIIKAAKTLELQQISFLPADVSSQAFNRDTPWDLPRQTEIMVSEPELHELNSIIDGILRDFRAEFDSRFVAESPAKLRNIHSYYSALHGLNEFPFKKCNAPWVSTVVEADGSVKPCFFHKSMGNIHTQALHEILNGQEALRFRRSLDMDKDATCKQCVCYLNLPPTMNPAKP
jgi:MoaA/NifB/PqqE/SkfB family radical SAM enzyme